MSMDAFNMEMEQEEIDSTSSADEALEHHPTESRHFHNFSVELCENCKIMISHIWRQRTDYAMSQLLRELRNTDQRCAIRDYLSQAYTKMRPGLETDIPGSESGMMCSKALAESTNRPPMFTVRSKYLVLVTWPTPNYWASKALANPCERTFWQPNVSRIDGPSRFPTAIEWFQCCKKDHGSCSMQTWIPRIRCPKRLVDISQLRPRLRTDLAPNENLPYAALSHCWGNLQPVRTTSQNLQAHLAGIELQDLPLTFRDAIKMTRALGMKYIWIDCLCIIQDSERDWEAQSANMAAIFASAEITLFAQWGADGNAGLFRDFQRPLEIRAYENGGLNGDTLVNMLMRPVSLDPLSIDMGPLKQRMWAMQEYLLSGRKLIFAHDQMHWRCTCSSDSEDGVNMPFVWEEGISKLLYRSRTMAPSRDFDDYPSSWHTTVANYSVREIKFCRDKLAAFAGIAKAYEYKFGARSEIGICTENLCHCLAWRIEQPSKQHRGIDTEAVMTLNLPSWTWLKTKGSNVSAWNYFRGGWRQICQFQTPEIVWEGVTMTSIIKKAEISGRGHIFKILEVVCEADHRTNVDYHYVSYLMRLRDDLSSSTTASRHVDSSGWMDQSIGDLQADLYGLILYKRRHDLISVELEYECMLLARVAGCTKTVPRYERLGIFEIEGDLGSTEQDFTLV